MSNVVILGRGEKPVVVALTKGATAAGLRPILQRPHLDTGHRITLPDVAAVFVDGIRGNTKKFLDAYVSEGVPVYIIELPRLRAVLGADRNEYGTTFGLYRDTLADLPMRVGNRVVVEGVLTQWLPEYLLVCGQKPADTSHDMDARQIEAWARETIQFAKIAYGLQVVYRHHPHNPHPIPDDLFGAEQLSPQTIPIRQALRSTVALVSYNSTCGIDAIDAGVPVLYTAPPHKVCYRDYAQRLGQRIEPLLPTERRTFLMRCGATQWTLEQMENGDAVRALVFGTMMARPELIEPLPEAPKPPLTGNARNRAMSREVTANGR